LESIDFIDTFDVLGRTKASTSSFQKNKNINILT